MTIMSVSEAKKHLLALVGDAQQQGKVFTLIRKGAPAAVLISEEQYRSVKETFEVLADPEEFKGIMKGRADIAAGRVQDVERSLESLDASGP